MCHNSQAVVGLSFFFSKWGRNPGFCKLLVSQTQFNPFSVAISSRSYTKVSLGTDEREGSYTGTRQEPPAGK
jgi:hypothetical protein